MMRRIGCSYYANLVLPPVLVNVIKLDLVHSDLFQHATCTNPALGILDIVIDPQLQLRLQLCAFKSRWVS